MEHDILSTVKDDYISDQMSERTNLANLPNEILLSIFSYLLCFSKPLRITNLICSDPQKTIPIALISKRFHTLAMEVLYKTNCFAIDVGAPYMWMMQHAHPNHFLLSHVFQAGREQIKHIQLSHLSKIGWAWLIGVHVGDSSAELARELKMLLSNLQESAPRLVKIDFVLEILNEGYAWTKATLRDEFVRLVEDNLLDVKEIRIVSVRPIGYNTYTLKFRQRATMGTVFERSILLALVRKEKNGAWEEALAPK